MIKTLLEKDLRNIYTKLPIGYFDYLKWLDGEDDNGNQYEGPKYYHIATTNILYRQENEWNEKGREIYDESKLNNHVDCVMKAIEQLRLNKFIIQHEYKQLAWFQKYMFEEKLPIEEKMNFFNTVLPAINVKTFKGGLLIEDIMYDLDRFLRAFVDYPFSLKYKDIDIISTDIDLVIKITHHLSIDFVTLHKELANQIIDFFSNTGIRVIKGNSAWSD